MYLNRVDTDLTYKTDIKTELEKKMSDIKNYYVNEYAVVDENVEIGEGTKVWHFSHIQSGSKIGKNCVFGQNVNVGNNVIIGDYCKVQNNVSIYE